jgi:ABC-type transport system, involved in lipoprotein release, permease component
VALFGWASPAEAIGKKIASPSGTPEGEVIGVVKDYHKAGLQQKIGAVTMDYSPENSYLYAIRYKAADTQQLISQLNTLWSNTFPGYDFNYFFLDESFEKQYQSEKYLASVFGLFAGITIIIALIGLLGLVSFMIAVRTKEIGIRKILGADVLSITKLISLEFIGLVFVAGLISVPLIWYFASEWLEKFAYRMTLSPLLFIITISFALIVTLLTISLQSIKAATANPINSLRTE